MKTYKGVRSAVGGVVTVQPNQGEAYTLPWRLDLWNHSPTGLNWGYGGSGPAQCALALLADHLDDDQQAIQLYQPFKWLIVAKLPFFSWELTSKQIDDALTKLAMRRNNETV